MPVLGRCPKEQDTFAFLEFTSICFENSSLNFNLFSLDAIAYPQPHLRWLLNICLVARLLAIDLFSGDGSQVHGQQNTRLGKLVDSNHGSSRSVRPHLLDIRTVHALEILHIFEEDVDMDDVIQIRSDRFQHDFEGFENLLCL